MKQWLLALLLIPNLVLADTAAVTLSWTNATQNEDASIIPTTGAASLVSTTLYWSICGLGDTVTYTPGLEVTILTTIPGNAESNIIDVGTAGRWCFTAFHTNFEGIDSAFSGVAVKDIPISSPPQPPQFLQVTSADIFVYSISQSNNVATAIPQGTIAVGTVCNGSMTFMGRYQVPREDVAWAGTSRPPVVFAACL